MKELFRRVGLLLLAYAIVYVAFSLCGVNGILWAALGRGPSYYWYYGTLLVALSAGGVAMSSRKYAIAIAPVAGLAAGTLGLFLATLGMPAGPRRLVSIWTINPGRELFLTLYMAIVFLSWVFGAGMWAVYRELERRRYRRIVVLLVVCCVVAAAVVHYRVPIHF
jgi:hypothetical protein